MEGLLKRLKDVAASSQKLQKRLAAYEGLLDDPVQNAFARQRELVALGRLVEEFPDVQLKQELGVWLAAEKETVAGHRDEFRFRFGSALADGLREVGLTGRGQLPVLRAGLFTVRVDFEAGRASVFWGPEVEKMKSGLPLSPGELSRTLRTWTDDLRSRALEPSKLARMLEEAYSRVVALKQLDAGARVTLTDVLGELVMLMQPASFRADPSKARFVEYPRVRFSYDMYRLRSTGTGDRGRRMRLHVATFDATTSKTTALWVPDNEDGEGTHYGYISYGGEV